MFFKPKVKPKFIYYFKTDSMSDARITEYVNKLKTELEKADNYENEQWYFIPSDKNQIVTVYMR